MSYVCQSHSRRRLRAFHKVSWRRPQPPSPPLICAAWSILVPLSRPPLAACPMRQRSSKASRAKTQATGFYQPKHNASRSYSTSGDGRRKTTLTKQFLDYQAVARQEELHAAPQPPPRATPLPSSDESLASALGDDAPAPERVPGLAGVAVATKTHAKRYESSVSTTFRDTYS